MNKEELKQEIYTRVALIMKNNPKHFEIVNLLITGLERNEKQVDRTEFLLHAIHRFIRLSYTVSITIDSSCQLFFDAGHKYNEHLKNTYIKQILFIYYTHDEDNWNTLITKENLI